MSEQVVIEYLAERNILARKDDFLTIVVECSPKEFQSRIKAIKKLLKEVGWNKTFRVI